MLATGPREELYRWLTITFSQTLGTALGDWIADHPPTTTGRTAVDIGRTLDPLRCLGCGVTTCIDLQTKRAIAAA